MGNPKSPAVQSPEIAKNDLNPKLEVTQVPLSSVQQPRHPVRQKSAAQIKKVMRSIKEFGAVIPALVLGDGEIVDGVARIEAARKLGLETFPCISVDHLSEQQVRLLRITLNKTAASGDFDPEALRLELEYQLEFGADVTISGFEPPEIDCILNFSVDVPREDDPLDDVTGLPASDKLAVTQAGDLWLLGKHRVLCGSAREAENFFALIQTKSPALLLTDPPYNVPINGHVRSSGGDFAEFLEASGEMTSSEFVEFLFTILYLAISGLARGALVYCFMDWRHIDELREVFRRLGLDQINLAIWVKPNGGMGSLYRSRHELVFIGKRHGEPHRNNVELGKHGRNRTNVWEYAGATGGTKTDADDFSVHPTVKPVALLQDVMLDVTVAGERVIDPFLGSGSSLLAAERARRVCLGMEISPAYVDVTIDRWQRMTGSEAVHAETGLTFAATAEIRAAGPDGAEPAGACVVEDV